MTTEVGVLQVRNTRPEDFDAIIDLCRLVYTTGPAWSKLHLASHLEQFCEGQFVALDAAAGELLGMASSLIVQWDDYDRMDAWRDLTDHGMFTNHDPEDGRTLYAAEVMVRPNRQGRGIGTAIYRARFELARQLRLRRIRAGARLRGYHRHAEELTPEQYVHRVVDGEIFDPTLSFQLRRGFEVLDVIPGYLRNDPESLGFAALIEWINGEVTHQEDTASRPHRFDPTPPSVGLERC